MKVYNKLDELKSALAKSQEASGIQSQSHSNPYSLKSYSSSNDVERLHSMMQAMNQDKTEDPEISQLNQMLDKIQAIQNPDEAIQNNKKTSTGKSLTVKTKRQKASVSLLKPDAAKISLNDTTIETIDANRFYSDVTFNGNDDTTSDNAIGAIIPETQTLVAGATIKLVLTNDVMINDVMLPSGSLIYGTTSLSNERLKVTISSIRFQNSILPVSLDVYDMDGQQGIYVPGSINRTVAKESANNAMSGIGTTTVDPSIGAQAASAGIEAAKTLMTKKVKLVKMTIKAGYKVLLKDSHDK